MAVNYKAIAKKLKFEGRAFINGKYVNAIDGKKFETINPATGEKLCTVAKCNHKDVDLAVKVSRKGINSGVWSSKINLYLNLIKKSKDNEFSNLSEEILKIDLINKGLLKAETWEQIERVILKLQDATA